ncbi:hypothetical protein MLP_33340 [Microlunatus phosphovorus NM-1]|uniref:Uncharacterized protein n=1 Tax=Microlunatus phosphovorus (strain ATCC 700054 / DSM 10555 / JCM 9379 / NBRC 101784 / NCIMB 13414 / VKM Ac-1990 / NM-1) TaxID=1032480 RepID=F5XM91_MICPN|nr:hypothetical protein [Microlunatus phosphovorus]BAK36348.1 hypothetical protein MLP_33340 [Microlunatus phosphovorus NM-1]
MSTPPADPDWVPVSPLLPDDPPRVGEFWLDARIGAAQSGVAYTAHSDASADLRSDGANADLRSDTDDRSAMVIVLSQGAAADAAARDRLAGVVNDMHIDTVLARGGHGQDFGRLGRKYVGDDDDPNAPAEGLLAPWVALAYDGSPAAASEAARILDEVQLATLPPQGMPSGPDYQHYWQDRIRPGLVRLWPLPWPGRHDRAGWVTILVSWLLMLLLAALAVLIAILIFRNQPPQTPPTPTGGSGSPPPMSQSGSPPPQSGSPSGGQSGSPSGSESGSNSPSQSGSGSASPSPSGSQSGGGGGTPAPSGSPGANTPTSRL